MDIIDIILAKKLTPQGQVETYAAKAQTAAEKANKARNDADAAIAAVEAAADEIAATKSDADDLLTEAQQTLETAQQISITLPEVYEATGQNTDGYMTQKAVTDALGAKADTTYVNSSLSSKADSSTLNNYATKQYVSQQIAAIPTGSGGSISNLGIDNAGKIVIVGDDGNITAGSITEENITSQSGSYIDNSALGLIIDYGNKNFERTLAAINKTAGADFDTYTMFGGRMRCNVADDGTINAFYGDPAYIEDGSNGQVMIYQPKFYYQRVIIEEYNDVQGRVINKEQLLLSQTSKLGFKLHPLFKNGNDELDYVLLPVYEGNIYDTSAQTYILDNGSNIDFNTDKLSSIAGTRPLSGISKSIGLDNFRTLAANRGTGWQLTDIKFESALQMLEMIEFGSMNIQAVLGKGIVYASNLGEITTGSTYSLGNISGRAEATTFSTGGPQTADGKTAINYRGMENPWGNLWRIVDKITVKGSGSSMGGTPYYNNETSIEFNLPNTNYEWVSNMGYNSTYDWIYMPIKCGNGANSALPVGDTLWVTNSLNGINKVLIGGNESAEEGGGPFDYSCDHTLTSNVNKTNARIMFIPTKNEIYNSNITKWQQKYGG